MCKVLRIARAGFYQWLHKPVSDRDQDNHRLLQLIRSSYAASRGVYGARRVFGDLREAGETCGKHRVARLMRANKIKAHLAGLAVSGGGGRSVRTQGGWPVDEADVGP